MSIRLFDENGIFVGPRSAAILGPVVPDAIRDYAERRKADAMRRMVRIVADAALDRSDAENIRSVDRGQATDAPSRVAPLTGLRHVAPFGGASRTLRTVLEEMPETERFRAAYRAWRAALAEDIPLSVAILAQIMGVSDTAAMKQVRAWSADLSAIHQGEQFSAMMGERHAGGNATPEYAEAWCVIAPYVATDRWEATILGAIRRIAQENRGRRPDYSIRDDVGQAAVLRAAETIADLISRELPNFSPDAPMAECSLSGAVARQIASGALHPGEDFPKYSLARIVDAIARESDDLVTVGDDVMGWLVPRWRRCGHCDPCRGTCPRCKGTGECVTCGGRGCPRCSGTSRCQQCQGIGTLPKQRTAWCRMAEGSPVGCDSPVLVLDLRTPGAILHRALASEISSDMRAEVRQGIVRGRTDESQTWLLDQGTRVGTGDERSDTSPLDVLPDAVSEKIRLLIRACEISGDEIFGPRGALSPAASEILAMAFGRPITEKGQRLAREDMRLLAARTGSPVGADAGVRVTRARAESAMRKRVERREARARA